MGSIQWQKLNREMSEGYWKRWNPEVQARIDRDIEANRKADGRFKPEKLAPGSEVRIEQLSHGFFFGSHIFNFDQLGSPERNRKYKELFGTIFNSATIAFYWKQFELEEGKPRFAGEARDRAEYWDRAPDPKNEPHWRRPATDPVVAFCEAKGIRLHGHTLTWGNRKWQVPDWLVAKLPSPYREECLKDSGNHSQFKDAFAGLTPAQIEDLVPGYIRELNDRMARRIEEIANHYGGRLQSWDIANESATDFERGNMIPGDKVCKSHYGLMPGDYTHASFKVAERAFPAGVLLNINDYNLGACYPRQVEDLVARGCKVDVMGAQMHLFDPKTCVEIAEGRSEAQSPESVRETMERLATAGKPLHLSEITIPAPGNDARGQAIQAVIARNLYRLWFSVKPMMGITWWNLVDDCGAPGEPSVSGLFSRDMEPKPAFHALRELIQEEWMTRTTAKADGQGIVSFRGFRGKYRMSWRDASGSEKTESFDLI